ncbi:capsid protein [Apis mellifera virus-8]|nr:capsid protein [Apis mellifera virus-8]QBX89279.1 capsid protein [Apis mellifera virus-8]QBX89281.1 capsid protein [Apis mellifera virus-8]QBX89283.1 capsid protein [Apis mellifera virus-8]QBX89285.1 capsid protein [Apis mellifera virus-8]
MPVRSKRTSGRLRRSTMRKIARKGLRKASIMKNRAPLPRVKKIALMGTGLPAKVMVRHKYVETFTLTATGIPSGYTFRANSMFDPNFTGTGHQPLYFDQYANLYNHYTVIGSKITFTFAAADNVYPPFQVAALLDDDGATATLLADAIAEQTQGSKIVMMPADSATSVRKITLKFSAKKQFGGSVVNNANLRGNATTNPAEQMYYIFSITPRNGDNAEVRCTAHIEYIAIWTELKDVVQS